MLQQDVRKQRILKLLNLEDSSSEHLAPSRLRDREASSVYRRVSLNNSLCAPTGSNCSTQRRALDEVHDARRESDPCSPKRKCCSSATVHQPARMTGVNYVRNQWR